MEAAQRYGQIAHAIVDYRDKAQGGVLKLGLRRQQRRAAARWLPVCSRTSLPRNFGVRNVEIVGPQVGKQLQKQAVLATLYSLAGMLVYLWFRFELIYGAAAVVACFHDTIITVGVFSLLNQEISLTVIAAILTLVGYSMNDTIVVFDRIRENVKLLRARKPVRRREPQHQPDAEPDGADLWADFPDRAFAVPVRRRSAARILARPGDRHHHWHLLVDFYRFTHAGGLSELARG